ncbi:hypothetical protein FGO68_gene16080 [Halteria grandinella]|uniref:Transmembrane protein 222 n=1 Tax=Halteria grandinella TaxID=5974 RepID=A0A8J8SXI7_HALGN|nr:hypothetical protein FGO68_gene16080 [Halteria grandinella]
MSATLPPTDPSKYSQVHLTDVSTETPSQQIKLTKQAKLDPDTARFPHCIVWTPLPLISWFLPFIGHTGIGMSDGVLHDFAGPYTVTVDDLAFGETHKYVKLDITDNHKYDQSLLKADRHYEGQMHNICCNNCHSHVACTLNKYNYRSRSNYTMVDVWWMTVSQSKYVSVGHVIKTYLGFAIILAIIAFFWYM